MKVLLLGVLFFTLTYLQIVGSESICAKEAYREDCGGCLKKLTYTYSSYRLLLHSISGYYGIDEEECEEKGCCWSPLAENSVRK